MIVLAGLLKSRMYAFNGLQGSAMFKEKMLRATQVPMQEFICFLRFRHLKVWREANFSCPRAVNKEAVTYHKWCGSSEFAKSHELKSRPHAMLWLSKLYGFPAGMYASQVWGCI